jgi:hypothetical protein
MFHCDDCKKEFKTLSQLKRHLSVEEMITVKKVVSKKSINKILTFDKKRWWSYTYSELL